MKLLLLSLVFLFGEHLNPSRIVTLHHTYYTTVFDEANKTPLFSFYTLYGENLSHLDNSRTTFHADTLEALVSQSNAAIYEGSGYDKGHLSPDDDFRFDKQGESESMVYTNCAPQVSSFNRGVWKKVEDHTRKLALQYDSVKVITGVIFSDKPKFLKTIPIPAYFYKIDIANNDTICFLCTNAEHDDHEVSDYQVTFDSLSNVINYHLQ